MNPATGSNTEDRSDHTPAIVVRRAIADLNSLDAETADHLNALAFLLMRVARADGSVCDEERYRMEEILIEHADIRAEHAALVAEIACHRTELADCGDSYTISRGLRGGLDREHRRSIFRLLVAVADADGSFLAVEHREVEQIARELGIPALEIRSASFES